MKTAKAADFSPLLSDRVRLTIMASLAAHNAPIDFRTLLETLELTKGNLSTHVRKLEDAGLVQVVKRFVERKPKTTFVLTKKGREEIKSHLRLIERALRNALGD